MLRIDPEFEKLIPPLSAEEFAQLEENILCEGRSISISEGKSVMQRKPQGDKDTRMDGISLSTATGAIVDDLVAEYGIGKKRARILLANCLLRTMVQTDIYSMADHIMRQEEKRKEARKWRERPL